MPPAVPQGSPSRPAGTWDTALSSPPPGFSGPSRLPDSRARRGGQGPGAPAGTGLRIPPGPGPYVRVACPMGAASRSGLPAERQPESGDRGSWRRRRAETRDASAPGLAGCPVCSPRAGVHRARPLHRLPVERRGGPETTTWGQLQARRGFDPCLWCELAQISHPEPKECSLYMFCRRRSFPCLNKRVGDLKQHRHPHCWR